ncbi:Cell wall-associated polypeptide CWBP200 [Weeksella virosa]|uniref:FG-GAP-like repeat-containing protein n=1 Tax=Weeksella virosa TaxID=1014 RepID=UPI000E084458|nr:FG-GAP-like repeat-containing protein [Weeksella virosa]SUP53543.1 Cell wall-associated polypeptide CWBP200 [Weeksella virosa]
MRKYFIFLLAFVLYLSNVSAQQSFHDTTGNIEVDGGGQLNFTLPIALPPGIKKVAPQINLVYTSNSANGIAGYGWNLSGLTNISRTGKNLEKDGESKSFDLSYSDFYQFNGQRLILKSGEYGKDGALYTTENFSNALIKSHGTITGKNWQGPEYFEVTFEDGSQAWYGATASGESTARTPVEYNIVKWIDAQSNYITYTYTQSNNVSLISKISWGGNESLGKAHFNSIVFVYDTRKLPETTILNGNGQGIKLIQNKILSSVTVNAVNKQFKKYAIEYGEYPYTNYQYIKTIKEFNAQNEIANPIEFSYQDLESKTWKTTNIKDANHDNKKGELYGDFDGDGELDLIINDNKNIYLYKSVFKTSNPQKVLIGNLSNLNTVNLKLATTGSIKSLDNNVIPKTSIVLLDQVPANGYNKRDLDIYVYTLDNVTNQLKLEFKKVLSASHYDMSGEFGDPTVPIEPGMVNLYTTYNSYLDSLGSIDVDGNSLSELMLQVKTITCETQYGNTIEGPGGIGIGGVNIQGPLCTDYKSTYVLNINEDVNLNIGQAYNNLLNEYIEGDFDGDGITDYLKINNNTKKANLAFFKKSNNNSTRYMTSSSFNPVIGHLDGIVSNAVAGDFNGDGKTDLLVPKEDKKSDWFLFLSNGKGFEPAELKSNLTYFSKEYVATDVGKHNRFPESTCVFHTGTHYEYKTLDLNNDGRSELVVNKIIVKNHEWRNHYDQEHTQVLTSVYSTIESSNHSLTFNLISQKSHNFDNMVVPFSISHIEGELVVLGKPDDCGKYDCESFIYIKVGGYNDLAPIRRMNSITQGGIITKAVYKPLDASSDNTFYKSESLTYPYFDPQRMPKNYVIAQLQQENKKQDFLYRGMMIHLRGKGLIGFRQQAKSTWYVPNYENTKVWSVIERDPNLDGNDVKIWTIKTNNDVNKIFTSDFSTSNRDLLSLNTTEYLKEYYDGGNKLTEKPTLPTPNLISAIVPKKVTTLDNLTKVNTVETFEYNQYYLPVKSVTNINNGYSLTTKNFYYANNPNGIGKDYYIGRPTGQVIETTAYGNSMRNGEFYYYTNNLLTRIEKEDRNAEYYIIENFVYDGFGNVIQKTISNNEDGLTKTTKSSYDARGRFVIRATDNLNISTNFTFNDWGQLLTETDTYGNKTTNTYDNWGKLITSHHNLTGTTSYSYEKDSNGNIIVTENDPIGNYKKTFTNKYQQQYKVETKGFNTNSIVNKEVHYDAIGRKIRESEPYYNGETIKYNTIVYDDSVYPAKITATSFTGKIVSTSINGLVTTTKEENGYNRTTTQETDALGNVIKTTDPGGTITYKYNAVGQQISATYGNNIVTTKYDHWGRKSEFHDPSNGLYKYFYNGFGDIIKIESPKGHKSFTYNAKGQLINQKEIANDASTNKNINFTYNTKGVLTRKTGTVKNAKGTNETYTTNLTYDANGRLATSVETSNGRVFSQKGIVFDQHGRITSFQKSLVSNGVTTEANIENVYHPWSGALYQVKDKNTGDILWQLDETLAGGQVLKSKLGRTSITNTFDANNFLTSTKHISNGLNTGGNTVLDMSYSFNALKNELNTRQRNGDFNSNEVFTYDQNNRMTNWTNPTNGLMHFNVYDEKGRIIENNQLGKISFPASGKIYQPSEVELNNEGNNYYRQDLIQQISYNENNDPIYIEGVKGDAVFSYGLTNMRQKVTYGGNFSQTTDGQFTKLYDETGSFEVVIDHQTGQEKHVLYIGGSPYEANIMLVKDFAQTTASYHFLHKDYLGSILAITNAVGTKVEQRHYDAWGNFTHLKIGSNPIVTDPNTILQLAKDMLIDRGYTSHEHFLELGIIHMNGRLYDSILRRFLNADENIQDPTNTQNYNKYGYVFNNPLLFNDPNGEFFVFLGIGATVWKAIIIGATIGLSTYSISVAINGGKWQLKAALKSTMWGAISGAVTFGIGSVFSSAGTGAFTAIGDALNNAGVLGLVKAGTHAVAQGVMSLAQGGNFSQAFIAGALGSLGAAAWTSTMNAANLSQFAQSTVGMVSFGAISGGVGSALSGGNFFEGALIGGVVAGLNDAMHKESPDNGYERDENGNYRQINTEGGDTIDYLYENEQIVESREVIFQPSEVRPSYGDRTYGYKWEPVSPNLIEVDIIGGKSLVKGGYSLLKLGVNNMKVPLANATGNLIKTHAPNLNKGRYLRVGISKANNINANPGTRKVFRVTWGNSKKHWFNIDLGKWGK